MKSLLLLLVVCLAFVPAIHGFGANCPTRRTTLLPKAVPPVTTMPANYKVAFLGDAGSGTQQEEVLEMVKSWGAQVVVHSGDFEYLDDAELFEQQLDKVLGPDFPYFASIGNHDVAAWDGTEGHERRLTDRLKRFGGDLNCTGDYGVNMVCSWNGLYLVLSGAGTLGSAHAAYIDQVLTNVPATWKVVSWHKNQRLMQIGGKTDETGWAVYDTARKHGAIIATGHEHSYCRSYMMTDFEDQVIANRNHPLEMKVGESFVFVSGLGGKDIRTWETNLKNNPWWASAHASNDGVSDGALLCTFNTAGVLNKAYCIFQDRLGKVWDNFNITSSLPTTEADLQEALQAEEKREQARCRSQWVEVAVTGTDRVTQASESGARRAVVGKVIDLATASATTLTFENVPLKKGARLLQANLQVYGANTVESVSYSIRGPQGTTSSIVNWSQTDEGAFDRHEVWVSPDLKDIVAELLASAEWVDGAGTVSLTLSGQGALSFYSFARSPCWAPTLAFEVAGDC